LYSKPNINHLPYKYNFSAFNDRFAPSHPYFSPFLFSFGIPIPDAVSLFLQIPTLDFGLKPSLSLWCNVWWQNRLWM